MSKFVLLVAERVKGNSVNPGKMNKYEPGKIHNADSVYNVIYWDIPKIKTIRGAKARWATMNGKISNMVESNFEILQFSVVMYDVENDKPVKIVDNKEASLGILISPTSRCSNAFLRKLGII